uniref:Uncharacterized protein n=1 Tax=Caenorhabditis tropicalis TaxID=1561998 RepID=A0A1I7TIE0_9PELO
MDPRRILFLMVVALFFITSIIVILTNFEEYGYCPYLDCNPRYYGVEHPLRDYPKEFDDPSIQGYCNL